MCVAGVCSQTFFTPAIFNLGVRSKKKLGARLTMRYDENSWGYYWDHFNSNFRSVSENQPSSRVIFTFIFFLITSSSWVINKSYREETFQWGAFRYFTKVSRSHTQASISPVLIPVWILQKLCHFIFLLCSLFPLFPDKGRNREICAAFFGLNHAADSHFRRIFQ